MAQYFPEYNKLRECWVGRAYDSSLVTDTFVKDILDETEEDLSNFSPVSYTHLTLPTILRV